MEKPYSPACDRNKEPILKVMKEVITEDDKHLLEIGSGTGQHAVFLAPNFPHLQWHPTDLAANIPGMKLWFDEAQIKNIKRPQMFEVGKDNFPKQEFDLVFTANTFHVMEWKQCKTLMKMWGQHLREGSSVMIYGPFNYQGQFTSAGNAQLDAHWKKINPLSGIRSFEDVVNAMEKNGFELTKDYEMPANNRMLVFLRIDKVK